MKTVFSLLKHYFFFTWLN